MSVVPPGASLQSYPPEYIRKYQILITGDSGGTIFASDNIVGKATTTQDGQTLIATSISTIPALDVSPLRCTFQLEKNYMQGGQYGSVSIYNLDATTETNILAYARQVTISAGYLNGPYGQIWAGNVFQPTRGKEDAVTYYVTLRCLDLDDAMNAGFCNFAIAPGYTALKIAQAVARNSNVPFNIQVDPDLDGQQTQRSKAVFGPPKPILRRLSQSNNASLYTDDGKAYISSVGQTPPTNAVPLNVNTGMVGMPQQIESGVRVRSLINPNIKIAGFIKLNNKDVIPRTISSIEQNSLQTLLDLDGLYRVIQMTITGDSRGNDWYMDLETVNQAGFLPLMLNNQQQSGF